MDPEYKSSWAEEVELDSGIFPPPSERIDAKGNKVITEYKLNKDGKKIKVVRTFKVTKHVVSKNVARRKRLAKFGDSSDEVAGPNARTTFVSEDISMQHISNKEGEKVQVAIPDPKTPFAKCRFCDSGHFTTNCPFSNTQAYADKILNAKPTSTTTVADQKQTKSGKYVPPFSRDGYRGTGDFGRGDDSNAIRIANLSEDTTDSDLHDLTAAFGQVTKTYLAREKGSGVCKGFAYVHFLNHKDAEAAIGALDGFGYDHQFLKAEWSKPFP